MQNNNDFPEEEKFSDDPEENLRLENEFIKMKLMAESGAIFDNNNDLPPEIESVFLKNILEFEKQQATSKFRVIKDVLGNPFFKKEEKLNEKEFKSAYKKLQQLLRKHQFEVSFNRPRTDRFKYHFITEELFNHETTYIFMPGMTVHFSYEEFNPDHELELKEMTERFLDDFLNKKLSADTYYIDAQLMQPDGNIISRADFMKRFEVMFEETHPFEDALYMIHGVLFELKDVDEVVSGLGSCEGKIQYDILFLNGERKQIDGSFIIYFSRMYEVWNIFYFRLAGFNI
ncbi:MAG: hypothetical protein ABIN48_12320 [Ginsengibacter sp.]